MGAVGLAARNSLSEEAKAQIDLDDQKPENQARMAAAQWIVELFDSEDHMNQVFDELMGKSPVWKDDLTDKD